MTHNNRKGIQSVNRVSAINARAKKPARPLSVRLAGELKKNWALYLMILPVIAYYIIFAYIPMSGVVLAFKDFKVKLGIFGSPWAGLKHFERFFGGYNFWLLLRNTVGISLYTLLVGFPIPILFALLLNYLKQERLRKTLQMVSYAPYFISTVVMVGLITLLLSPGSGVFGAICNALGFEAPNLMGSAGAFKHLYVWTDVWQHAGWDSIIFLAALAGVDPSLYEAATVDGATALQKIRHVDIPMLMPTAVIMLIMRMGNLMNLGFEKVYLMQNDLNLSSSEVISTYVYKIGVINTQYSYSAAINLFSTIVNFVLLITVNEISKRLSENSLW